MAIYHMSVKAVSRSAGRSSTGAAAYRSAEKIVDSRTGEVHDYTRKGGVESSHLVLPDDSPKWANDRAELWNAVEHSEKRKDSCVAREYEVALPSEMTPRQRQDLALDFAREISKRYKCAVDVAIHQPGRGGDNRNYHAHIMRTTRELGRDGFGAKCEVERAGRDRKADLAAERKLWEDKTNLHLQRAGLDARVDCRSLEAQGIDREPTQHLGPAVTAMMRRGETPDALLRINEQLGRAKELGELERQSASIDRGLIDTQTDLGALLRERAKVELRKDVDAGISSAKEKFQNWKLEQAAKRAPEPTPERTQQRAPSFPAFGQMPRARAEAEKQQTKPLSEFRTWLTQAQKEQERKPEAPKPAPPKPKGPDYGPSF